MNEFHEHREQIYVQDDPLSDEEAGENDPAVDMIHDPCAGT